MMPSNLSWYILALFLMALLSLAFAMLQWLKARHISFSGRLLLLFMGSTSLYGLSILLCFTDFYLRMPHLWRVFTTLGYLNAPLCFLYLRASLHNQTKFQRSDLLVAVPMLFNLVNMLPFLLSDKATKMVYILRLVEDKNIFAYESEGMLPDGIGSWIRMLISVTLVLCQILILSAASHHFRHGRGREESLDRRKYRWFWMLTNISIFFNLATLLQIMFHFIEGWHLAQLIAASVIIMAFFTAVSLSFSRSLLEDFRDPLPRSELFF